MLDPKGDVGISYREHAHIARAWAERPGATGRALEVRDKLERAWARQRERDAQVTRIVTRLLEHDEETAEQLLQQAAIEHRRLRQQRKT